MMMSLFQAWQQCPRMSSYEVGTRLDSQFSRMNRQIFSTGLSSGYLGGKGIRVMLSGTGQVGCEVPSGLVIRADGLIDGVDETEATAEGSGDIRFGTDATLTASIAAESPVEME